MMRVAFGLVLGGFLTAGPALASPWAEVGDNQLRGDVDLLAAAGAIADTSSHWPIPWTALTGDLDSGTLAGQPEAVQAAAARIGAKARQATAGGWSGGFLLDATNRPGIVYGFDGLGRGEGQTQLSLGYNSGSFSGRLSVGAITGTYDKHDTKLMLDGSYIAAKVGGALVYAGELSHWWGPGWMSALSLSNNARPMPQIGIERLSDTAFSWPVLRWLGPWQGEFFVGLLDGPRIARNTVYDGLRFTFNPAPGLQIGLARTDMMCGTGHPCMPLRDYFHFANDPANVDKINDEGEFDITYRRVMGSVPFEIYTQFMNEDSSPFTHSGTSHLVGASVYLPIVVGSPLRLTAEFADSIATADIFSSSHFYAFSYTNYSYTDGMRYRGRTIGFSLDDDSRLLSLQGAWSDSGGRFYEVSFHHANISNLHSIGDNIVSPLAPVSLNMGEARVTVPFRAFKLDLAARYQDRQIPPKTGDAAAIEAALRINL
jgi:hypothetical protein